MHSFVILVILNSAVLNAIWAAYSPNERKIILEKWGLNLVRILLFNLFFLICILLLILICYEMLT